MFDKAVTVFHEGVKYINGIPKIINHTIDQFMFDGLFGISIGIKAIEFFAVIVLLLVIMFCVNKNNPMTKRLSWGVTILGIIEIFRLLI